ncbi:MAG: SRPBCC family protein [Bryobacteraceae bacterium]|nr:SRPBCC family protein [Bryobacteraceae bacterium]
MSWTTIALYAAAGVAVLFAGFYLWGRSLPESHTASAEATLPAPRDRVFARISDFAAYPKWRPGVKSVERKDGGRFIETGENGTIPFRVTASEPGVRMTVVIDTSDLPFSGTWEYQLQDAPGGTLLRITENGRVTSPLFRALGRLFFPHDRTMKTYLANLRGSFEAGG